MSKLPPEFSLHMETADFARWIATKNPFYAISAALVLLGLWVSFGSQADETETWMLMAGLASYTLLLAATAFGLVRYLKLWNDARTVSLEPVTNTPAHMRRPQQPAYILIDPSGERDCKSKRLAP